MVLILTGIGCNSTTDARNDVTTGFASTAESIDDLLTAARRRSGTESSHFALRAMEILVLAVLHAPPPG